MPITQRIQELKDAPRLAVGISCFKLEITCQADIRLASDVCRAHAGRTFSAYRTRIDSPPASQHQAQPLSITCRNIGIER